MSKTRAYWILFLALWAFTLSPIFIRLSHLPASFLVGARLLVSLVLLFPFWRPKKGILSTNRNLLISGVAMGAHFILWTLCLDYTSISSATIAVCLSPFFIVLISRFFLHHKLPKGTLPALLLTLIGAVFLFAEDLQTQAHGILGILLALGGALLYAIYIMIAENARKTVRLLDYVFPVYGVAMLVAFGVSWFQGFSPLEILQLDKREWGVIVGLAIFPTILGHTAMNYIVKTIPASTIAISGLLQPLFATFLAIFLFQEIPSWTGLFGGLFSLAGVYTILRQKGSESPVNVD